MSTKIFMQSDSDDYLFLRQPNLQKSQPQDLFDLSHHLDTKILPHQCSTIASSIALKDKSSASLYSSSKKIVNSAQGKLARERKKKYLATLESQVEELEKQVRQYEEDIQKTKETLAQTLNSNKNVLIQLNEKNQNSITYSELQLCIESEDPNEDKINLLLDMIKFRIGASGHERQAKIQYYFKQLVNTLFPAIHRYLMYCSDKRLDLFEEHSIDEYFGMNPPESLHINHLPWISDFLTSLEMTETQKQQLLKLTPKYVNKKHQVKQIITNLKDVKEAIKAEEKVFENMIDELRGGLRPVQAAAWVLFSDKSKYKREVTLQMERDQDFLSEEAKSSPGKKVKKD